MGRASEATEGSIDRRTFLRAAGGAAALAAAPLRAGRGEAQTKPKNLVLSNWGGEWGNFVKESVDAEFTKRYGIPVVHDPSADNAARITKVKLSIAQGTYDLIHLADGFFARAIDEGILEKLNYQSPNFTNTPDVDKGLQNPYWPAAIFNGMGLAYNPGMVKEPPTSWADLWKPEYKGKIVLPGVNHSFGLYVLFYGALAAGKEWKDVDTGLEMLKRLTDQRPVWSLDTPTIMKMFQREEAALGWLGKAEVLTVQNWGGKTQFAFPTEGGIYVSWGWAITKGSKNVEWAERYINITLDPQVQALFAKRWNYAGSNAKWVEQSPPEIRKRIEWRPEELRRLIVLDQQWITRRRAELTEKWNKIVGA